MSGTTVHPLVREVPVQAGACKAKIRPWTMAQRAELRPRVAAMLSKVLEFEKNPLGVDLADLFGYAEDELAEICRATVQLPEGVVWDDLLWEDLPILVQAVWDVCVVRGDGGGLAGKMGGALAGALQSVARLSKTPPQQSEPSSPASPSSPDAGAPTPNGSATA